MSEQTDERRMLGNYNFGRLLSFIAEGIKKELNSRGIATSQEGTTESTHKITLMVPWSVKYEVARPDQLRELAKPLVIEMGIKIARATTGVRFFELELPIGTLHSDYGTCDGVILRGVVDYDVREDEMTLRLDALVRYDDE